jgi:hypothetical protein
LRVRVRETSNHQEREPTTSVRCRDQDLMAKSVVVVGGGGGLSMLSSLQLFCSPTCPDRPFFFVDGANDRREPAFGAFSRRKIDANNFHETTYGFFWFCVVLCCVFLNCIVLCCVVLSCVVLSCLVLSCLVLSCFVLPCLVLYCLALPCLVLSCLVLSCLVSSCLDAPHSLKFCI